MTRSQGGGRVMGVAADLADDGPLPTAPCRSTAEAIRVETSPPARAAFTWKAAVRWS